MVGMIRSNRGAELFGQLRQGRWQRTRQSSVSWWAARSLWCALLAVVLVAPCRASAESFGFENVAQYAQSLSTKDFEQPGPKIADALLNLNYDQYRNIRFRPEMSIWRDKKLFELQLFHPGFLHRVPVRINIVQAGQVVQLPFRREMFNYEQVSLPQDMPEPAGFAGFRVHFPLHTPEYKDEIAVFLGASYFRVLGRGQVYGASARGLAIDTAMPDGEEFPLFREFWIVEPGEEQTDLHIFALLDSPSVAGAYEFRIRPGTRTITDVRSKLFFREDVDRLGIAPLTSMFFFGENSSLKTDDYRPQIHDSDGLLMNNGLDEWIWRPLVNPTGLRVSAFLDHDPHGFGLVQRDRIFANYLDLEAHYQDRPTLWVEPEGDWGQGTVQLVEIPTPDETNDNIVAFWVPDNRIRADDVFDFSYRLIAEMETPLPQHLGYAVRTRMGSPGVPGSGKAYPPEVRLFVIDFGGGDLAQIAPGQPVQADLQTTSGRIIDKIVVKNTQTGSWRVAFRFDPEGAAASDLKLSLSLRGAPMTETWTYLWTPSLLRR
jgi:glucans biosynthesis protein